MLKQIISVNKVHIQNNVFDYDKCKKLHKELFNNVHIELKSINNAGHKDSSANTNEASVNGTNANNIQYKVDNANNNLLNNQMLYYFNKLKKIKNGLNEYNESIKSSLNKIHHNSRVKLHEFKKVNDKLNLLLNHICLFIFNKKAKKESIIENVNVTSNIKEYTVIIDNKRVCLGKIEEYLCETIDDMQTNINNKEYEKVLVDLLSIHQYILKSINKMYMHTKNNKINNNVNKSNYAKKATKKSDLNNTAKISIKHNNANKKIASDNNANKKINNNNANKKITGDNSANKKITSNKSANTNVIRKRKNNVDIVNEESICNNSVNKLKQD